MPQSTHTQPKNSQVILSHLHSFFPPDVVFDLTLKKKKSVVYRLTRVSLDDVAYIVRCRCSGLYNPLEMKIYIALVAAVAATAPMTLARQQQQGQQQQIGLHFSIFWTG